MYRERQQGFATNPQNGIVHLSEEELRELAVRIRAALSRLEHIAFDR
jgi:hypothetical protein